MNIRDIPADYATFENFNRDYEKTHYRLTEASWRVGAALRLHGTLAGLLPARHPRQPSKIPLRVSRENM